MFGPLAEKLSTRAKALGERVAEQYSEVREIVAERFKGALVVPAKDMQGAGSAHRFCTWHGPVAHAQIKLAPMATAPLWSEIAVPSRPNCVGTNLKAFL